MDSTRFLNEGDTVKVGTDDVTVDSVTDEDTVVFTASFTSADNDEIKRRIGTSTVDEPDGIALAIDDAGTIGGLARSTRFWWQSKELGASGVNRPLTLALMDQLNREVEKRKNEMPSAFFSKPELRDVYGALLQQDARYVNTTSADGQKKKLSHKDVPFETDFHASDNVIYAPTWDSQTVFESGPVNWMDDDGSILSRVSNKDAYEMTLKYYCQYGTDDSRINAKLTDISES